MKYLKRVLCAMLACMLTAGVLSPVQAEAATSVETFVDNDNGTVDVTFTVAEDATILVMVTVPKENVTADSNEQTNYYYKLTAGKNTVSIPLTRGAGTYKVRVLEKLADGRAKVLASTDVVLGEDASDEVFSTANFVVDYEISDKFIKKAKTLTKSCKTETAKVKKIYNYIIKNYQYDYELLKEKAATSYYNPDNTSTFTRELGICYDISSLFAAMLRSVGIEARVVTGYTPNVKEYHAWTQVYDSKKKSWYTIDATTDMCLYNSGSKKYTMVKKDSDYCDIKYIY